MAIKKYTVTLEEDLVDQALSIAENYGGKLSPILNRFLERWVAEEKLKLKKIKEEGLKK